VDERARLQRQHVARIRVQRRLVLFERAVDARFTLCGS